MRMENLCLGAHPGSLNKNLVARTCNLGAPGDRAPVRQQPCMLLCFLSRRAVRSAIHCFLVSNLFYKARSVLGPRTHPSCCCMKCATAFPLDMMLERHRLNKMLVFKNVVFLGKTLYSHSASLHPSVRLGTSEFIAGGNPAMD